jgi:hypothetical protein
MLLICGKAYMENMLASLQKKILVSPIAITWILPQSQCKPTRHTFGRIFQVDELGRLI